MRGQMSFAVVAIVLAGCATAIRGTTNQVTFASEPSGAIVTTSLGQSCITPCVIAIDRNKPFEATFRRDGFEHSVVAVRTEISREGGTSFAGNLLLGGPIGMGVDAVSGAALDHQPNPVVGRLAAIVPTTPPPIMRGQPSRTPRPIRAPVAALADRPPIASSVTVTTHPAPAPTDR